MSSFDKIIKLACKPKAASPKAKYIDPIVAATLSSDVAIHDICKALSTRIRESNALVVFKALIVLHTIIRTGATNNVLSYLSSSQFLDLRNVSTTISWAGYIQPRNVRQYALYLDSRIHAYKDLKHDIVRAQVEYNRDMRNVTSMEKEEYHGWKDGSVIEKGSLREGKVIHAMIVSLVECQFDLQDMEADVTSTALRMLVKDLITLFQAANEGIDSILAIFHGMSQIDAIEALQIYRQFCQQTKHVIDYLQHHNKLNVAIPSLTHVSLSMAGAMQKHLQDPNFELNRIKYKANKLAAERATVDGSDANATSSSSMPEANAQPSKTGSSSDVDKKVATTSKAVYGDGKEIEAEKRDRAEGDGKDCIDEHGDGKDVQNTMPTAEHEQSPILDTKMKTNNTTYIQQRRLTNPFAQMAMATEQPVQQPQHGVQPTGVTNPRQSVTLQEPTPIGSPQRLQQSGPAFNQKAHVQPQQPVGLSQSDTKNSEHSQKSMLVPPTESSAVSGVDQMQPLPPSQGKKSPSHLASLSPSRPPSYEAEYIDSSVQPVSSPITSHANVLTSTPQPPKPYVTRRNNPFELIIDAPPSAPNSPTIFEASMGLTPSNHAQKQEAQPQPPGFTEGSSSDDAVNPRNSDISSIASFSFRDTPTPSSASSSNGTFLSQDTAITNISTEAAPIFGSSLSSSTLDTATTNASFFPWEAPVKPHIDIEPFSSFGASLMETFSFIADPAPDRQTKTAVPSPDGGDNPSTLNFFSSSSSANGTHSTASDNHSDQSTGVTSSSNRASVSSTFGSSLGVDIRPRTTSDIGTTREQDGGSATHEPRHPPPVCYLCGELMTQSNVRSEIKAAIKAHYATCPMFDEAPDTDA